MPASPQRPTNRVPGPTNIPGEHANEHNAVAAIVNNIYKKPIGPTRTGAFTLSQNDQAEVIPINVGSAIKVTVPSLQPGTCVDLVQVGAGGFSFVPSGVALLPESPGPVSQRGGNARLVWLTSSLVDVTTSSPIPTTIDDGQDNLDDGVITPINIPTDDTLGHDDGTL